MQVYAFSSDNWRRSDVEVAFLMSLFTRALRDEGDALKEKGVRFRSIGDTARLPTQLQREIERWVGLRGLVPLRGAMGQCMIMVHMTPKILGKHQIYQEVLLNQ